MKNSSLAKITRPSASGIFERKRLFTLLDSFTNQGSVWISAPAGSGKTAFVASYLTARNIPAIWYQVDGSDSDTSTLFYYMGLAARKAAPRIRKPLPLLTPEYLPGITNFTRRYFENLYRRLTPPFVLVFDNYQDVPLDSFFHEIIVHALSQVPEGISLIFISRASPPQALARWRASEKAGFIGWDEIKFDFDEMKTLVGTKVRDSLSDEILKQLHEKTDGWAAGLVLFLESLKMKVPGLLEIGGFGPENIFDYFADEIFEKIEKDVRTFLLKTAFLPGMTGRQAEKLTETGRSEQILSHLNRNNYFTGKLYHGEPVFKYHPLFRQFLLSRAMGSFSPEELSTIRKKAAGILEESGQIEAVAGLLFEARDWNSLGRLIPSHAQSLIAQGRSRTLQGWIERLPKELVAESPWLLFWLGACTLPFSPPEARLHFERAYTSFRAAGDPTGLCLSWTGIVDTFTYEWGNFAPLDQWIGAMKEFLASDPGFPSPEIEARVVSGMFNALMWRQPQDPDLPMWAERVLMITLNSPSIPLRMMLGNHLVLYYLWMGDISRASLVINALKPASRSIGNDPLTQQTWWIMYAMYAWSFADHGTCLSAVREGTRLAESTDVHLLDFYLFGQGVYSGNSLGDLDVSTELLSRMAGLNITRIMDICFFHYLSASTAWYHGNVKSATEHGELALKFAEQTGAPLCLALCHAEFATTLFDAGRVEEALVHLQKAEEYGRGMHYLEFMCSLLKARIAFSESRQEEEKEHLLRAFGLGARQGCVNFSRWHPAIMSRLCSRALKYGIQETYVRELIRKRNLLPDPEHDHAENWPWPIRIHTLGRFELVIDGKSAVSSGKVQQRPLSLLKALIAFGGRGVTEDQVLDALWPETEGDMAGQSFRTALHRLRRLLGSDGAIRVSEGRMTLDSGSCWVDARDFEQIAGRAERFWEQAAQKNAGASSRRRQAGVVPPNDDMTEIMRLTDRAVDLYKGHFLEKDRRNVWSVPMRERLRTKFLRLIVRPGRYWEERKQWEQALKYFQKGLDIDDLAEEFYQHIMTCHQRLGRNAEAVKAYQRCRKALLAGLGAAPSPKTEAIYRSLRKTG